MATSENEPGVVRAIWENVAVQEAKEITYLKFFLRKRMQSILAMIWLRGKERVSPSSIINT